MRRPLATGLAVLAAAMQILLATATPLGVVLCVGDGHAGLELASNDCCASHGAGGHTATPTLARSCCSDVPLHAAAPSPADGVRVASAGTGVMTAGALPAPTTGTLAAPARALDDLAPTMALVLRSIVLRV